MDYAWQRLSAAETGAVERHLADCPACRAVLEEERAVGAALAAVPPAAPRCDMWTTVRVRQMAMEPDRLPAGAPSARMLAPVLAARAQVSRMRMQWGVAVTAGLAVLALMLAPGEPARAPASGAVVLAQTLDTARQVDQQSDDPMGEMSDSALDILSVASMDAGKDSPS